LTITQKFFLSSTNCLIIKEGQKPPYKTTTYKKKCLTHRHFIKFKTKNNSFIKNKQIVLTQQTKHTKIQNIKQHIVATTNRGVK